MTATANPNDSRRLLGTPPTTPLPHLKAAELIALTEAAGLTGRGGAGFPTAIKLKAVTGGRSPIIVGNAMEGEPMSHKDALLLTRSPGLVLDGLELVARALKAQRAVLAVGPEIDAAPAKAAAKGRKVTVKQLTGGFIAGQESALVNQLNGGPNLPKDPLVRVTTKGVGGRPTLVINAETLAQLALLARNGVEWFRSAGTSDDPGTSLFTITGAVEQPGVVEAGRGTPLSAVLASARPINPQAVLVGGYHGAWIPASALDVALTRTALAPYSATVGAGILHVLSNNDCPIAFSAKVATYLANESARQCGPCVNGLPKMAEALTRLAHGARDPRLTEEILRLQTLVTGRGACAHPDGTARFVGSTMRVFSAEVDAHLAGRCSITGVQLTDRVTNSRRAS